MVPNLFMITGVEDIVILTIIYIIFTVEIWRNHKKKFIFKITLWLSYSIFTLDHINLLRVWFQNVHATHEVYLKIYL